MFSVQRSPPPSSVRQESARLTEDQISAAQELQRRLVVNVVDVPGTANPADAFTKHLDKTTFRMCMARLYNCDAARI